LKRVHRFHRANPQVLDFLVLEMRAERDSGWKRASLGSLWYYGRSVLTRKQRIPGETFVMSNNLFPHYGRMVAILHHDLNGFFSMTRSAADADFGTALGPKHIERGRIRLLQCADGTPLEKGWRPSKPHEPKPFKRRAPVRRAA